MSVLARPTSGKVVAGVCAALARRFGLSPNVVRLLFLVSCLLPGPQVIVYAVLWIVLPREDSPRAAGRW